MLYHTSLQMCSVPMTPTISLLKACLCLQIPFLHYLSSIAADKDEVGAGGPNR